MFWRTPSIWFTTSPVKIHVRTPSLPRTWATNTCEPGVWPAAAKNSRPENSGHGEQRAARPRSSTRDSPPRRAARCPGRVVKFDSSTCSGFWNSGIGRVRGRHSSATPEVWSTCSCVKAIPATRASAAPRRSAEEASGWIGSPPTATRSGVRTRPRTSWSMPASIRNMRPSAHSSTNARVTHHVRRRRRRVEARVEHGRARHRLTGGVDPGEVHRQVGARVEGEDLLDRRQRRVDAGDRALGQPEPEAHRRDDQARPEPRDR